MTKNELVWLIIRSAGVYFGYLMLASLFGLTALVPSLIFSPPDLKTAQKPAAEPQFQTVQPTPFGGGQIPPSLTEPPKSATPTDTDKAMSENARDFLWHLFFALIYGAVGFYLLKDGRLFYFLLMREDASGAKETEPEVTTLNL